MNMVALTILVIFGVYCLATSAVGLLMVYLVETKILDLKKFSKYSKQEYGFVLTDSEIMHKLTRCTNTHFMLLVAVSLAVYFLENTPNVL